VTTDDGYILTVHHIFPSAAAPPAGVVLLQHGVLDSSDTWVLTSEDVPNECLPFLLATLGWDVYLGNTRGNVYSQAHHTLSPTDPAFWQFTFDEFAHYDLPAKIDFILGRTGAQKLVYVGHSEGTLMMFAHSTISPNIADKVELFVALAPVTSVAHIYGGFLRYISELPASVIEFLFGNKDILPRGSTLGELVPALCKLEPSVCDDVMCLLAGCLGQSTVNTSRLADITAYVLACSDDVREASHAFCACVLSLSLSLSWSLLLSISLPPSLPLSHSLVTAPLSTRTHSHFPSGSSVMNILHYKQLVENGGFRMYDFGSAAANNAHYNQSTPPDYPLGSFSVRTAFFTGSQDTLADPTDVQALLAAVPAATIAYKENFDDYGHADFIWVR
jgi:pimeloyl-ACP methyl ester carboxylesterase